MAAPELFPAASAGPFLNDLALRFENIHSGLHGVT
jgi:hypothetical protein